MADYRTSIDYAMNYGLHDPVYDMLRRRLRDQISGLARGEENYALGRLEARNLGQSGAVPQTLASISGSALNALGTGSAEIAKQQANERFQLMQQAIQRDSAKPGFWDVFPALAGAAGTFFGGPLGGMAAGGLAAGLRRRGRGTNYFQDYGMTGPPNDDQGY